MPEKPKRKTHPMSDETKAKMSAAHMGKTPSEETRAKISAGLKARHAQYRALMETLK